MKQLLSVVAVFSVSGVDRAMAIEDAFDDAFLLSYAPVALQPGEFLADVTHGFATRFIENKGFAKDLPEKSFGFRGANIGISVTHVPLPFVVVRAATRSRGPGALAGLGLFFRTPLVAVEGSFHYRAHRDREKWRNSFLPVASVSLPFLQPLGFTLSAGATFDSYEEHMGTSTALGFEIFASHEVFAEYFPRVTTKDKNENIGSQDAFSAGWRWTTGGHEFVLALANTSASGPEQAILGSDTDSLNFAFRISRHF